MDTRTTLVMEPLAAPTAVAVGFFDGVHLGHQEVMRKALAYKGQGLRACVFSFTTSGSAPTSGKASAKILDMDEKQRLCREMGVDVLVIPEFGEFCGVEPEDFVNGILHKKLGARVVSCGSDFRYGKGATGNIHALKKQSKALGIGVEVSDAVLYQGKPISSTRIRRCLAQGDIPGVEAMLGRCYSYSASVMEGKRLGRELGFPTLNQYYKEDQAVPRFGVYASFGVVEGRLIPAVTSIGDNPTVGVDRPVCETHLIGADENLYGCQVRVGLLAYLRELQRFESLEALVAQIKLDVIQAEEIFGSKDIAY